MDALLGTFITPRSHPWHHQDMANIHLLGIPMDLGAGRRGVDMGASALRLARLAGALERLGHSITDHGNIDVAPAEATKTPEPLPYVQAIADVCEQVVATAGSFSPASFPIFLGGDHAATIGSFAAMRKQGRTALLWIDAHADLNTPAHSPSGNIHGMPVAVLLGEGDERLTRVGGREPKLRPEDVVYIGLRSVDSDERSRIEAHGIRAYTMSDIDRRGMAEVAAEALTYLAHHDRLHVSFDADVLDPDLAPGVGTPVPGGLSYREAHLLMEMIAKSRRATSLDLVEVNPILDVRNRTAEILVEMTASLFGKRIL